MNLRLAKVWGPGGTLNSRGNQYQSNHYYLPDSTSDWFSDADGTGDYVPQSWNTWQQGSHDHRLPGALTVGCSYAPNEYTGTTTALTLAPALVDVKTNGPVVATAIVKPTTGTGTPAGTVNFLNGGSQVGRWRHSRTDVAVLNISTPAPWRQEIYSDHRNLRPGGQLHQFDVIAAGLKRAGLPDRGDSDDCYCPDCRSKRNRDSYYPTPGRISPSAELRLLRFAQPVQPAPSLRSRRQPRASRSRRRLHLPGSTVVPATPEPVSFMLAFFPGSSAWRYPRGSESRSQTVCAYSG